VSDHHLNILAVTTGFTGAASDILVQRHAAWLRRPDRYFSPSEYVLGDKVMLYSARVVGPHKGEDADTPDNRNFAWQLARLRVVSEHTIGILKGRWSSLRDLRLQLRSSDDVVFAFEWCLVCCILHNLCNELGDTPQFEKDLEVHDSTSARTSATAARSRRRVQRTVLDFMKARGIYKALLLSLLRERTLSCLVLCRHSGDAPSIAVAESCPVKLEALTRFCLFFSFRWFFDSTGLHTNGHGRLSFAV